MKKITKMKIKEGGVVALAIIGLVVLLYGISLIATCGIIKLITICFGLTFNWSVATGIWLVICLLQGIFKSNSSSK